VIASFHDQATSEIWQFGKSKEIPAELHGNALRKLYILNAAVALENLMVPPGNRLEKLKGDREGQYSIRINDKYRICFEWIDGNAHRVEIVGYH
jgi:proteic killer suppression protein